MSPETTSAALAALRKENKTLKDQIAHLRRETKDAQAQVQHLKQLSQSRAADEEREEAEWVTATSILNEMLLLSGMNDEILGKIVDELYDERTMREAFDKLGVWDVLRRAGERK